MNGLNNIDMKELSDMKTKSNTEQLLFIANEFLAEYNKRCKNISKTILQDPTYIEEMMSESQMYEEIGF